MSSSMEDCGSDAGDRALLSAGNGLNSGPQNFPIEVALEARLTTSGAVGLPAVNPVQADLGVVELVLLWTAPAGNALGSGSAGAGNEADHELSDAVLLPEAAPASESSAPRPFWDRCRSASPRLGPKAAPLAPGPAGAGGGRRYAFIFDSSRSATEPGTEQEVVLTPLDALYLARLCAHDDGQHQLFPNEVAGGGGNGNELVGCPPHLLSSDEVLAALLTQHEEASASSASSPPPAGAADYEKEATAAAQPSRGEEMELRNLNDTPPREAPLARPGANSRKGRAARAEEAAGS